MKFWLTDRYYGGDITLIEQASRELDVQLVAIKGRDASQYSGNREYVKGNAEYLFVLEGNSFEGAKRIIYQTLHERVVQLYREKYG